MATTLKLVKGQNSSTETGQNPVRGSLQVTEGALKGQEDGTLHFMFNPSQYSISKSLNWDTKPAKGKNVPSFDFGGGEPRQIQLELFFDASLPSNGQKQPQDTVMKKINQLFRFMEIDDKLKNSAKNSKMGRPSKCLLIWGRNTPNHFDCYIKSCQVKYTLFNAEGFPIRATATLTLIEGQDAKKLPGTNPTSQGESGQQFWIVKEGDRLDWIAYEEYGDAGEWRRIAQANHLMNPLDLRPGMALIIPPR